jgi:hypothetical protein
VLSYGLWKDRYAGDPSLVGRTIAIDGADFTVIGVMPREFEWQFWVGGASCGYRWVTPRRTFPAAPEGALVVSGAL